MSAKSCLARVALECILGYTPLCWCWWHNTEVCDGSVIWVQTYKVKCIALISYPYLLHVCNRQRLCYLCNSNVFKPTTWATTITTTSAMFTASCDSLLTVQLCTVLNRRRCVNKRLHADRNNAGGCNGPCSVQQWMVWLVSKLEQPRDPDQISSLHWNQPALSSFSAMIPTSETNSLSLPHSKERTLLLLPYRPEFESKTYYNTTNQQSTMMMMMMMSQ
jgi:hypothetical protein